jgi:uncharacterized protein (DUF58 family)
VAPVTDGLAIFGGTFAIAALLLGAYGFALLQKRVYRRHWDRNLTYSLNLSKNAAFEGEIVTLSETLSNRKGLPLPWVHVGYTLPRFLVLLNNVNQKIYRGEHRSLLYGVGARKAVTRRSAVLCGKRGHYVIRDFALSSNNLLMSELSRRGLENRYALTVYPRLTDFPENTIPFRRLSGAILARRFTNPDPFAFRGIREYQPTDHFRQINWCAAARTGELMSNVYDYTVSQEVTVLLNLQEYNKYDRDFVHEESIRLAAFLCRRFAADGIPVSLVCPSGDGTPIRVGSGVSRAHLETAYTALAHIDLAVYRESAAGFLPLGHDRACVVVSSYAGEDFCERYEAMRSSGVDALWIAPLCDRDAKPEAKGIVVWEVRDD